MLPLFNIQRINYMKKLNTPSKRYIALLQCKNSKVLNVERARYLPLALSSEAKAIGMGVTQLSYCTASAPNIPVAYYDEIKDLPNHPDKLLVDVREPGELQQTGQIPTSINVPLGEVKKAFSNDTSSEDFAKLYNHSKPNVNDQIILSCQSGRRSQIAAEKLAQLGYKQVKNYKGSWLEWAEKNGLPK